MYFGFHRLEQTLLGVSMKRLLIAGYEGTTKNYRKAFASLGIATEILTKEQGLLSKEGIPVFDFCKKNITHFYDGLVLPGGGDIAPEFLDFENIGSRNIDLPLDQLQFSLLEQFVCSCKPILGICKGMQLINVFFGGSLIQDLPETSLQIHAYDNGDKFHGTKASRSTFIGRLYGTSPITNSAHHQALSSIGDGLFVAQYACDFVVEAIYHKSLPIFGVQWHPERMCSPSVPTENNSALQPDDGRLLLHYFSTFL